MNSSSRNKRLQEKYGWMRVAGQCAFIPIFLALYPIAFYFIGMWLDSYFETEWIKIVFLFLGFISGFRQSYFLIRNLIRSTNSERDDES